MKHLNSTLNGIKEIYYRNDWWGTIEEMPIYNWIKICETGDLKYIYKKGGRVSEKTALHWLDLQQQYIDEFGLDEDYKKQLRIIKELTRLNCDYVLKRDRFLLNLIKIKEAELNTVNIQKAYGFYQIKDYVEKYKGFKVDPKKTTVIEWFYALKNMSDGEAD